MYTIQSIETGEELASWLKSRILDMVLDPHVRRAGIPGRAIDISSLARNLVSECQHGGKSGLYPEALAIILKDFATERLIHLGKG
jgi:hypothetical protein